MNYNYNEWKERLSLSQKGHYSASEFYLYMHNLIGIPLVVLSGITSAFIFFSDNSSVVPELIKYASLIIVILASVQTFYRPAEKAEAHRASGAKYGNLKRKLEAFIGQNATGDEVSEFNKQLMVEWEAIANDSPLTPKRFRSMNR